MNLRGWFEAWWRDRRRRAIKRKFGPLAVLPDEAEGLGEIVTVRCIHCRRPFEQETRAVVVSGLDLSPIAYTPYPSGPIVVPCLSCGKYMRIDFTHLRDVRLAPPEATA